MADPELEAIRQRRMQELMAQRGGTANQPNPEQQNAQEEAKREAEERRQMMLSQIVSSEAQERSIVGMSDMKEESSVAAAARKKLSCTTYFDALMFCYSPVHQMQQYYRAGQLDNCSGKWSGLVDCLTLKTKRSSEVEEILEAREKEKTHIWSIRTPEEGASNWNEMYGHLDEVE